MAYVFDAYKESTAKAVKMIFKDLPDDLINKAIDYSINKRYTEHPVIIDNNYTHRIQETTLLKLCDYINDKKPILTSYGVLFQRHGTVPNPISEIIQGFLDNRTLHKKEMLKYPRHSEMYEKYNLMQLLDKLDANATYGTLGQYKSLVYNRNVATSITAEGRSFISTAGMFFEQFLADNVKFSSLNEIVMFIEHTVGEKDKRKYNDNDIITHWVSQEECFAKLILDCGYNYIPDEKDMDIVWKMILSLDQVERNRVYYKNNLYEFLENIPMRNTIRYMMASLSEPFLTPDGIPKEINAALNEFCSILDEYVMNHYQVMDRIVRWQSMPKSVCVISDTDSAIVSLDAWVNYATMVISDMDIPIMHISSKIEPITEVPGGKFTEDMIIHKYEQKLDFDFYNDEIIEARRTINPLKIIPQDNVRYSLINIMTFVVSKLCNDYIEANTKNINSWSPDRKCKMYLKNEFLMKRILLTSVKKNYASILELQEGKSIPKTIENSLDVKGIEIFTKSTAPLSTRNALKEILYRDILTAENIDQVQILKDLAIFEKKIIASIYEGSTEYYKPATIKALNAYNDPMKIQGVKAIMAWNDLRTENEPAIDLNERNAINIAKVILNTSMLDSLKEKNPDLYERAKAVLAKDEWKGEIDVIALPLDIKIPQWVLDIIDLETIVTDNIKGFPLESINIIRPSNNIRYINILKL